MEKSIAAIQEELAEVNNKIKMCDELKSEATQEQKKLLEERRLKYEAKRDRLALALDILEGRAFGMYDVDGRLTILKPSESTAELLTIAQGMGAKVTRVCHVCGNTTFWQRKDGGWLCSVCHPEPTGKVLF
jgi:hypothetical protein